MSLKNEQIKITKTFEEIAKTELPKTPEDLVDLLTKVRKATIDEYRRKVTATPHYDTSNSIDGRDGSWKAYIKNPTLKLDEIELIAQLKF